MRPNDSIKLECENASCCNPKHVTVIPHRRAGELAKKPAIKRAITTLEPGVTKSAVARRFKVSPGFVEQVWREWKSEKGYREDNG